VPKSLDRSFALRRRPLFQARIGALDRSSFNGRIKSAETHFGLGRLTRELDDSAISRSLPLIPPRLEANRMDISARAALSESVKPVYRLLMEARAEEWQIISADSFHGTHGSILGFEQLAQGNGALRPGLDASDDILRQLPEWRADHGKVRRQMGVFEELDHSFHIDPSIATFSRNYSNDDLPLSPT